MESFVLNDLTPLELFSLYWIIPSLITFLFISSFSRYDDYPLRNWDGNTIFFVIFVSIIYPIGIFVFIGMIIIYIIEKYSINFITFENIWKFITKEF